MSSALIRVSLLTTILLARLSAGEIVLRGETGDTRNWESGRFRIDAAGAVPEARIRQVAEVAEGTVRVVSAHPLGLFHPPAGERMRIAIFAEEADYLAAGGRPDTAGGYVPRRALVVLHAGHLFRDTGGLRAKADEKLVVHELVHLCMHGTARRSPQWLDEGWCEYFAAAHRGRGAFDFSDMDRSIRDHLRARFDPRDPAVRVRPVGELLDLDSEEWADYQAGLPVDLRHHAYGTALLLTHYHLHGSDERRAAVELALRRGRRDPDPFASLGERSGEIDGLLANYWKPRGLTLVLDAADE